MDKPVSDDVARGRWMVLNLVRISGVAMVLVGVLTLRGAIDLPAAAGWVLVIAGVIDVFVVPQILARKWRSPLE